MEGAFARRNVEQKFPDINTAFLLSFYTKSSSLECGGGGGGGGNFQHVVHQAALRGHAYPPTTIVLGILTAFNRMLSWKEGALHLEGTGSKTAWRAPSHRRHRCRQSWSSSPH